MHGSGLEQILVGIRTGKGPAIGSDSFESCLAKLQDQLDMYIEQRAAAQAAREECSRLDDQSRRGIEEPRVAPQSDDPEEDHL